MILGHVVGVLIHLHHMLLVSVIRKRFFHFRLRWQCDLPPMGIRFLVRTKLIGCLIHQKVMFCTHLVHGCLDLLVKGTDVPGLLILGVLLYEHLPLLLHLMCLLNRRILHFIISRYSSNVVGIAWRLTVPTNLFMNLADLLFGSEILLMRSPVGYVLI